MSIKRLAMIAMMSTLSYVGRMAFSFIPNVQPTTTIIIIITLTMGLKDGMLVAIISMLMSNLYFGMGVWTIAQIISYVVLCIVVKVAQKLSLNNYYALIFTSGLTGLLYGFIISLVQAPFFGWISFIPYYISGIPFDIYHAVGNVAFFILLYPTLEPIIARYI